MRKSFNSFIQIFALMLCLCSLSCAQQTVVEPQKPSVEVKKPTETDDFFKRLNNPIYANQIASAMWTLTHDYSDSKRVDAVGEKLKSYFSAFSQYQKGNPAEFERLGGVKSFKDQLAAWLKDEDQATRAFSAVMLGVCGDQSYAPQLAELLKSNNYKERDLIRYDRARAAMSLGMLDAKEYTRNLVELLSSKDSYDRAGAALGLGYMKAKEHADAVRKLLNDKDEGTREAAATALKLMQ